MNGRRARKAMLNQLRNNILRNSRKVIRREVKHQVQYQIKIMRFRDKLNWLFGRGDLRPVAASDHFVFELTKDKDERERMLSDEEN